MRKAEQEVIPPVHTDLIVSELTSDRFLRKTNNGGNEIYILNANNSPMVMREIGRLREITFRDAGGGTGKDTDIDDFDTGENCFEQLIVWNPREMEIVGGYRYIAGNKIQVINGALNSPTGKLFRFSKNFIDEYLPGSIELGRSFVQPNYQPAYNLRKGMYSLDNIWDGLGAVIVNNPEVRYFFGKITMYPHYNRQARNRVLYFLKRYFPDNEKLAAPIEPLYTGMRTKDFDKLFSGSTYEENYKILVQEVRRLNENIPPLVNAYMNLSSTMRTLGTAINHGFGEVEETGIIVTINDINGAKKIRHLDSYRNGT